MMRERSTPMWALAAGCVPDAAPWEIPRIAQAAGFRACGMWVDPATTWDSGALAKVRTALDETGVELVDVEALWLREGARANDAQKLLVEVALELGAPTVLVVSLADKLEDGVGQFRDLCAMAGADVRINLEFGEFTRVRSLAAAREFIDAVDHPAAAILIDLMHLNRAGDALPALTSSEFGYVQACDFWQSSASLTGTAYIEAAVDARCPLGEGEARRDDIAAVCRSDLDVSLEIRSKALREAFPDPYARATQIYERCRRESYC